MNVSRLAVLFITALSLCGNAHAQPADVPLNFTRLDLTDGRKLKNVVVKSYDAKTQRLLIIADGKAMMIPLASVPPPFTEQLKAAPAAGSSVNTVAAPPRPMATPADQYTLQRPVPIQPQVIYVPQPAPASRPARVDPMLAQSSLMGHQNAARTRANRYFQYEHQMGSNSIVVTSLSLELSPPVSVPRWTGRFRTDGKAYIQYYDSRGGSFQRTTSTFEVTTEQKPGEALQVIDFSRKS
jgi:hypothetical protein